MHVVSEDLSKRFCAFLIPKTIFFSPQVESAVTITLRSQGMTR